MAFWQLSSSYAIFCPLFVSLAANFAADNIIIEVFVILASTQFPVHVVPSS